MNSRTRISRRSLLRSSMVALPGLVVPFSVFATDSPRPCATTPRQTAGPFYPFGHEIENDADLTLLKGSATPARGEPIVVAGQVFDAQCRPAAGAVVEIWQACWSGRYNHLLDSNPAPLDPRFQYYGVSQADEQGRYAFKTILPGAYPATANWTRPPHIHFKVRAAGHRELVTQMYFAGQPLSEADRILMAWAPSERERVVIPPQPTPSEGDPRGISMRFDLTLPA